MYDLSILIQGFPAVAPATVAWGGARCRCRAPIVTGFVVQATGSYNAAFTVAGLLLVAGTSVAFTMTRKPIGAEPQATAQVAVSA
ncbi:MAG: hypothetical protein ACRDRL_16410 [Sciscionella sp.]